ncbi:Aminopyrrolnitrin oxidase PrnD-like Rieske oxygenase [Balamuthia mandrillaris]
MWFEVLAFALAAETLYLTYLFIKSRLNRKQEEFARVSEAMEALEREKKREQTWPPYPNTWYALIESKDLQKGQVKSVYAVGCELVVWRKSDGTPVVLDAYCAHLGANLASGECKVIDDCVRCPFHHWRYDSTGKCVDIPYTSKPIPSNAKVHSWPVTEWAGRIWFYYHHERKQEPEFELPRDLDDDLKGMRPAGGGQVWMKSNLMEPLENCSDPVHFKTIHGHPSVPFLSKHLTLDHTITCKERGFVVEFTDMPVLKLFDRTLPFGISDYVNVHVTFIGPSIAYFRFHTPDKGTAYMVKSLTPVAPLRVKSLDLFWMDPRMSWFFGFFLKKQAFNGFMEDMPIWNYKRGVSKPLVVQGDGKIMKRRRWLRQFYPPEINW